MTITIGREFGSGGRELARRLSEELGIAYYDSEILTEIAKRTQLSENYVRQIVEKKPLSSFPIHIGRTLTSSSFTNLIPDQTNLIYQEQVEAIRDLAAKSDCVIVGRCADYILKDSHPLRIFVYADMEQRIKRCRAKAPSNEHLSDSELEKKIKTIDKHRKKYYNFYTDCQWGDRKNYDILINTSEIPIQEAVKFVSQIVKTKEIIENA